MCAAVAVLATTSGSGTSARAQGTGAAGTGSVSQSTTESSALVYDVASIKPNPQGPGSMSVSTNLDVYAATNLSLIDLLRNAYDLRPGMLSGEPKWAESTRFDIRAKILDATAEQLKKLTQEDRKRMLRVLLADRFHLVTHYEVKTLPVYDLLPLKSGAKVTAIEPEHRIDAFKNMSPESMSVGNGHLIGHYLPMKSMTDFLSGEVNRPVLDKTSMDGRYNFELNWKQDDAPATDDSTAPPLFKALEEQLGLHLDAAKEPVQTLVVDHVEMPTEN